jgi:hypothetical protein
VLDNFDESGNIFNVDLKEVCTTSSDVEYDAKNNRIILQNVLGRKAEVMFSYEGRMIEAPENTGQDSEEGDVGDEGDGGQEGES